MKQLILFALSFISLVCSAQLNPFLHVDQFGYRNESKKVLVISNPLEGYNSDLSYFTPNTLSLVNANTEEVVLIESPSLWNNGDIHNQSGDQGMHIDFSGFQVPGTYYWKDFVSGEQSATFQIAENPYLEVLKAAQKMFYFNRCNHSKETPFVDPNFADGINFNQAGQDFDCSYVYDPENTSLQKDLSGGWFDAGDYNKYVTFAMSAVHNLLMAYEENPEAFGDDFGIPESGNGLPDILDEVKWELDWLLKMIDSETGLTHIKMGSISYEENELAPPSANADPRYYGPTCTSASIANAFMLAEAAAVYQNQGNWESYAQTLETAAIESWNAVLPALENNELQDSCDDGSILSGDADWSIDFQLEQAVATAAVLFQLTGEQVYSNYVVNHQNNISFLEDNYWGPETMNVKDALLAYALNPMSDAELSTDLINSFSGTVQNNWNQLYGEVNDDLYLAHMPDWSYHWGSNLPKAMTGVLNLVVNKHEIDQANSTHYHNRAEDHLHYFHGNNPNGLVYLSNMYNFGAEYCVNELYHTWFHDGSDWDNALESLYGPPPGYLSGGPNSSFSVETLSPPFGQPAQKSYLDFNDDWPNNSWEISEPAIYYQAAYIRLLSTFVSGSEVPNSIAKVEEKVDWNWYPNPGSSWLQSSFKNNLYVEIRTAFGKLIWKGNLNQGESVDTKIWAKGVYFIQAKHHSTTQFSTWIKQ